MATGLLERLTLLGEELVRIGNYTASVTSEVKASLDKLSAEMTSLAEYLVQREALLRKPSSSAFSPAVIRVANADWLFIAKDVVPVLDAAEGGWFPSKVDLTCFDTEDLQTRLRSLRNVSDGGNLILCLEDQTQMAQAFAACGLTWEQAFYPSYELLRFAQSEQGRFERQQFLDTLRIETLGDYRVFHKVANWVTPAADVFPASGDLGFLTLSTLELLERQKSGDIMIQEVLELHSRLTPSDDNWTEISRSASSNFGLAYRLDKQVTGMMVQCRTRLVRNKWLEETGLPGTWKLYLALVASDCKEEFAIQLVGGKGFFVHPSACTKGIYCKPLLSCPNQSLSVATLLLVRLRGSGAKHEIRKLLRLLGSIVGDDKYGKASKEEKLFLTKIHASFEDGKTFSMPPETDFMRLSEIATATFHDKPLFDAIGSCDFSSVKVSFQLDKLESVKGKLWNVLVMPPGAGKTHLTAVLQDEGINAVDVDEGLKGIFHGYGEFMKEQGRVYWRSEDKTFEQHQAYVGVNYVEWLKYVKVQLERHEIPEVLILSWHVFPEGRDQESYFQLGFQYIGSLSPPAWQLAKEQQERAAGIAKWSNVKDPGLKNWLRRLAQFTAKAYQPRKDSTQLDRADFKDHCLQLLRKRQAAVGFYDVSEDVDVQALNKATVEELQSWFDSLTEVDPEYSHGEVSRSQSVGRSDHDVLWTYDQVVRSAGLQALGVLRFMDACSSAKIQATRASRLRACIRTASAIATRITALDGLCEGFLRRMWKRELKEVKRDTYVEAESHVQRYILTGETEHLRALDMKLSRHPGFDAPIGAQKKNYGKLYAAVLQGARNGEEWALRKCRVLLTGTRTRRIPFPGPYDLRSPNDMPSGEFTKVLAVRVFHYTNMGLIANGKPFQITSTEAMKTLKHSIFFECKDPFGPGALKLFHLRWFRAGGDLSDQVKMALTADRWDAEALRTLHESLQNFTDDDIKELMELPSYETDLELNDYRSVLWHGQVFQDTVLDNLQGLVPHGAAELWRATDVIASTGNYAAEGKVRKLKEKPPEVRSQRWLKDAGRLGELLPSTNFLGAQPSGIGDSHPRNDGNRAVSLLPFFNQRRLWDDEEEQDLQGNHLEAALACIRMYIQAAPEDETWLWCLTPDKAKLVVQGDAEAVDVLARKFALHFAMDADGDDAVLYRRLASLECKTLDPPSWMMRMHFAAVGKQGSLSEAKPLKQSYFLKRRCEVITVSGVRHAILVPEGHNLFESFFSPDKDKGPVHTSRIRLPALLSKLLMAYHAPAIFREFVRVILEVYKIMNVDLDEVLLNLWSFNDKAVPGLVDLVTFKQIPEVAERLFMVKRPECQIPHELPFFKPNTEMFQSGPELVLWLSDEKGQQFPKMLAAMGLPYAVHGLWDSRLHDPAKGGGPFAKSELRLLDKELQPPAANSLFREFERHGEHYRSFNDYILHLNAEFRDLQQRAFVSYLVLRHCGGDQYVIQELGLSSEVSLEPVLEPPNAFSTGDAELYHPGGAIRLQEADWWKKDVSALLRDLVTLHEQKLESDVHLKSNVSLAPAKVAFIVLGIPEREVNGSDVTTYLQDSRVHKMLTGPKGSLIEEKGRFSLSFCRFGDHIRSASFWLSLGFAPVALFNAELGLQEQCQQDACSGFLDEELEADMLMLSSAMTDLKFEFAAEEMNVRSQKQRASGKHDYSRPYRCYHGEDKNAFLVVDPAKDQPPERGALVGPDVNAGKMKAIEIALGQMRSAGASELVVNLMTVIVSGGLLLNTPRKALQEQRPEGYFELTVSQREACDLMTGTSPVVSINAPFGTGKSYLLLTVVRSKIKGGMTVMLLVPSNSLVEEMHLALSRLSIENQVLKQEEGLVGKSTGARVILATVDSARRIDTVVDELVVDEANRVTASQLLPALKMTYSIVATRVF